jgi:translocation and assembly module TamA
VRGFSYESLAPRDSLNNVLGGQSLLVGSAEVDYRFFNRWAIAAFADAGNAFGKISFNDLEYGVGGGLRYISPIGLVRIDGAFGISRKRAPFRLHITMGQDL